MKIYKRDVLAVPRDVTARKETPGGTARWKKLVFALVLNGHEKLQV